MKSIKSLVLGVAAAVLFTACVETTNTNRPANSANLSNANANTNANAAATTAAAPTKDALMTLEKSAWEAWKTKNASFWDPFLTTNFMGHGGGGRLDRAAALKEYAGAECDVKSYQISDDRMVPVGPDTAVVIYKVAVDATCGGQKVPANSWAAGVYVREGNNWKGAFHGETPVRDPNAPPAKPGKPATASNPPAGTTDALTQTLMAIENKAWEAWKSRDAAAVESIMAPNFTSLSGTGPLDRAASVKEWSAAKCEGLSFTLTDPRSVQLNKDTALVMYHGEAKGTCDGKPLGEPSVWAASVDVKDGDTWKNAFYMQGPE